MNSKTIIWQAFFKLLADNSADGITVRQICEQANVHRTTFYKHFRGMFDLVGFGAGELARQLMLPIDTPHANLLSAQAAVDFFATHVHEMRHLLNTQYLHHIQNAMYAAVELHLWTLFQKAGEDYCATAAPEFMARYHAGGVGRLLFAWINQPFCTQAELAAQIDKINSQVLAVCLKA